MSAKPAELQRELKQNAEEYQSYLKSLYQWEDDIKKKDEALKNSPRMSTNLDEIKYPIRNKKTNTSDEEISSSSPSERNNMVEGQKKQKAVIEKNKGNDFFKEGKYEKAISCYTAAIELDPSDPILPANRAIAFLKINRFAEAEDDCNKSISLDPTFVKAYHRRGTARASTGRIQLAKDDFEKVLSLEPHNKAAQQELERLLKQREKSPSKSSMKEPNQPKATSNKKEVHFSQEETVEKDAIKATKVVHYKKAVEVNLNHPALALVEVLNPIENCTKTDPFHHIPIVTVNDIKQEMVVIDKIVNQFAVREQTPTAKIPPSTNTVISTDIKIPSIPKNYIQFEQDWKRLSKQQSDHLLYQYLKQLPPAKLPDIFRESLETDILAGIIKILKNEFVNRDEPIAPWLTNLSRVKRITAVVLFLTCDQKSELTALVNHLIEKGEGTEEERHNISQKFS